QQQSPSGVFGGKNGNQRGVEKWKAVSEDKKGQTVNVLSADASMADVHGTQASESDMAEYLRGRVRGYTNSAMDTVDSALVPQPLSDRIIDLARNQSRVLQAGARTVDMNAKTLTIAKQKNDASVEWKKENESHTPSEISFEPLTFTA